MAISMVAAIQWIADLLFDAARQEDNVSDTNYFHSCLQYFMVIIVVFWFRVEGSRNQ